jgi:hypothetical protein
VETYFWKYVVSLHSWRFVEGENAQKPEEKTREARCFGTKNYRLRQQGEERIYGWWKGNTVAKAANKNSIGG